MFIHLSNLEYFSNSVNINNLLGVVNSPSFNHLNLRKYLKKDLILEKTYQADQYKQILVIFTLPNGSLIQLTTLNTKINNIQSCTFLMIEHRLFSIYFTKYSHKGTSWCLTQQERFIRFYLSLKSYQVQAPIEPLTFISKIHIVLYHSNLFYV